MQLAITVQFANGNIYGRLVSDELTEEYTGGEDDPYLFDYFDAEDCTSGWVMARLGELSTSLIGQLLIKENGAIVSASVENVEWHPDMEDDCDEVEEREPWR